MSEQQKNLENFNFTPGQFDKIEAWDGASQPKPAIGDYRLRITGVREHIKGYKLAILDFLIIGTYEKAAENQNCVGMEFGSAYAGDMNAPDAMLKRTKHLFFNALKLTAPPTSAKEIIGREIDATVCWRVTTDKDMTNALAPKIKQYVNVDLKGERPVGTPRPKGLNPLIESAKAIAVENGTAGTPQAWESPLPQVPAAATPASLAASSAPPVEEEKWTVDGYRALIVMKHPLAAQAEAMLVAQKLAVDGPIDETKLSAGLRDEYVKFKAVQAAPALPALKLG